MKTSLTDQEIEQLQISHDKLREALRECLAQLPYGNEALALKAQTALKESEAK